MSVEADIFLPRQKGYVVLDVESQGSMPFCPIEISCVRFSPEGRRLDSFSTLVRPYVPVTPQIVKLTGITDEMLRDAPYPYEIFPSVRAFLGECVIVGHAVKENDIRIVEHFYGTLFNEEFKNSYVDTFYWAQRLYPDFGPGSYNLRSLAEHLGIETSSFHRAGADCCATARLYQILYATASALPEEEKQKLLDEFAHKNDLNDPDGNCIVPLTLNYNALPIFSTATDVRAALVKVWHARDHVCMEVRFPDGVPELAESFMERHPRCGWQEYPGGLYIAEQMSLPLAVELMLRLQEEGYSLFRKDEGVFAGIENVRPKKSFERRQKRKSPAKFDEAVETFASLPAFQTRNPSDG